MRNYQKGIAPIIIALIVALLAGGGYAVVKTNPGIAQKLGIEKQEEKDIRTISLTIDSKPYTLLVQKLSPEYEVKIRDPKSDFDLSEPTDVLDALWSTPNRNTAVYLSLQDQKQQEHLKKIDKEVGGELLKDTITASSTPSTITFKTLFSYWVQVTVDNKTYRVFHGRQLIDGKEHLGLSTTLVKSRDHWLQTLDIDHTDLLLTIGLKTYEELLDLDKKSSVSATDATTDWKTYKNEKYGFELQYPNQFGQLNESGKNAYVLNGFAFSGEAKRTEIGIGIFTDTSINEWNTSVQDSINNNEPVGDPASLLYPLSVKTLLTSKSAGYDCTADFGEYLNKQNNESCQIVNINGIKAFKIIATGPHQSEVSELKYLFYVRGTWFDVSKHFWIYSSDGSKQLYTFEQLNSILQGKTTNVAIQSEVDVFNKMLSTLTFTK